jgi:hypothetical protein
MMGWVEHTIRRVGAVDDMTLVVRVHPAEGRWDSRELVLETIRQGFGDRLPANVRLIGPWEPLSSYALLDLADLVCVYTTTVGLEASTQGIPVAVAGETHYRGRGFTHDVERPEQLDVLLADLPPRLESDAVERALRYAYTFFYRASLPFPVVGASPTGVVRVPVDASQIAPGADPYLDFACERLLDGGSFLLPEALAR